MKNRILPLLLLFCFFSTVKLFAQYVIPYTQIDSLRPNLFSIEKAFLNENNELALKDSALAGERRTHFYRWMSSWRNRVYTNGDFPDLNKVAADRKDFFEQQKFVIQKRTSLWHSSISSNATNCVGRVNSVAMHPNYTDIIWAASAGGGLWLSKTGGNNWQNVTDGLPDVSTMGHVVIAPSAPNIVYAVTKDFNDHDFTPMRLLKTTDSGISWEVTNLENFDIHGYVSQIIVHPTNPDLLLLTTYNGIFRTLNGGLSWQKVSSPNNFYDLAFNPLNPKTVFALGSNSIYKSYDSGEHFEFQRTLSFINLSRMALTPADTNRLYFTNNNLVESVDGGKTFINIEGNVKLGNYSKFYANSIAASPRNANEILLGGISLGHLKITGSSAEDLSAHYLHADNQFIKFITDSIVIVSNDGGINISKDGGINFKDITGNMDIMQYYRISQSPSNSNSFLAGAQDNGTHLYNRQRYSSVFGGDGMTCFFDINDPNIYFVSIQNGGLYKIKNLNFSDNLFPELNGQGLWITPFVQHPTKSGVIYAGYSHKLYRLSASGKKIIADDGSPIFRIKTTLKEPDNIYFISDSLYRYNNESELLTTLKKPSLKKQINPTLTLEANVTDIAVSATNANLLWLTAGSYVDGIKVFQSEDGGMSWKNISEGLPNTQINCILEQAHGHGTLFLGTEIGVFKRDSSMQKWEFWSEGLPASNVTDLTLSYQGNTIRAATYGRGIWEAPLELKSTTFADFTELTGITIKEKYNYLQWHTNSENYYGVFTIERSKNNIDFSPIGIVNFKGKLNEKTDYEFYDSIPFIGDNYYRVSYRPVFNNEKNFSNTVQLILKKGASIVVLLPNPTNGLMNVELGWEESLLYNVEIFNLMGKKVFVKSGPVIRNQPIQLDLNSLTAGIYIFQISNSIGTILSTQKFFKD